MGKKKEKAVATIWKNCRRPGFSMKWYYNKEYTRRDEVCACDGSCSTTVEEALDLFDTVSTEHISVFP